MIAALAVYALQLTAALPPVGTQEAPVDHAALEGAPRDLNHTRRTLYLNRNGGHYVEGSPNDAAANRSSVVAGVADIAAFAGSDAEWLQLRTCVTLMFDRFSLEVTDVEPTGEHIEAVVGGLAADIGQTMNWGGYAPLPSCANPTIESSIVFVFTGRPDVGADMQLACEILAQEAAHALGLDHEYVCEDPMTYLDGCHPKTFQDVAGPCGEYAAGPCRCGGTLQNSVARLLERLGPADHEPPTLGVTAPTDGAEVLPGFEVLVEAQDNDRITKVELWIDGVYQSVDNAPPYTLQALRSLAPGPLAVEVRVMDNGANLVTAQLAVTLVAECSGDGECAAEQRCAGFVCLGDYGAACEGDADCGTGLCADTGQGRVCTSICSGPSAAACPAGTTCASAGVGFNKCVPSPGGCGCRVAGARHAPLGGAGILAALAAVLLARRRRLRAGDPAPPRRAPAPSSPA
jgi:MYXO-CTERM domain-containing protein